LTGLIQVSQEVADALADGRPVVALETSIVGQGLPAPHNLRAAHLSEAAIRKEGAVPASVAVLDGKVRVGLSAGEPRCTESRSESIPGTGPVDVLH
jgi:pseudouridine-5'-phosphate glycosidase